MIVDDRFFFLYAYIIFPWSQQMLTLFLQPLFSQKCLYPQAAHQVLCHSTKTHAVEPSSLMLLADLEMVYCMSWFTNVKLNSAQCVIAHCGCSTVW